ncbi:hypothetical protein DUNSADRAFT_14730 [Dunaliella salina]|uniref:Encoded protein n=1 Tax=Dunaliella salina TaxID=3046 RepID=A0ABQ7H2D5_DUNSA|nr:hypothetical protein DUNSADRAFT_14730 [Dunaliella salina]|eukprot:KAF5841024.1 hypothetical protein DUNSADRAFT_14730 [Dunaliella salina]
MLSTASMLCLHHVHGREDGQREGWQEPYPEGKCSACVPSWCVCAYLLCYRFVWGWLLNLGHPCVQCESPLSVPPIHSLLVRICVPPTHPL